MNDSAPSTRASRKTLVLGVFGLAAFLAAEALLLRHFIRVDARPPSREATAQLDAALDAREASGAGAWASLRAAAPRSPAAFALLQRGAYDAPDPARAALWINWWMMALLSISLFSIGWRFLRDSRALAGTLAFCAAPGLQRLLTAPLPDLALAAWVAAGYALLLASEGFTGWAAALAFGAVHAVGMLHSWTYAVFMVPAYLAGAEALGRRSGRLQVLAASALSLALFAPWYWAHLSALPARILEAAPLLTVSYWKGVSWLAYFKLSCAALGPPLWALGFLGLLVPHYPHSRDDGWIPACWVVFSYALCSAVPGPEIRYLLPGLAPLGLMMASAWAPSIGWGLAAFQLAAMLNFFFGALGPIPLATPLMPLSFLDNRPPLQEDWKTEEILRRVEADRDAARPAAILTLIADSPELNAPSLRWTARRLRLPALVIRPPDRRLCEFSEFVLLKTGSFGLDNVGGPLPAAAKAVADPDGWFARAYEKDARWTLPDGSAAVLYRQRRGLPRPTGRGATAFDYFEFGRVKGGGLRVDPGPWDPRLSAWPVVGASLDRVTARGLTVRGAAAELENVSFAALSGGDLAVYDWNELRMLRLDRLSVRSLSIDGEGLKAFLEGLLPGLRVDKLVLEGTAKASGRWNGRPVAAEASVALDRTARRLNVRVLAASILGAPLPAGLFFPELALPLDANERIPFAVDLPGVTLKGGRLTVP
jgi:hypothetical protein